METKARYIKTLTIIFDLQISNREIPLFRGAILQALEQKGNLLFHNHIEDTTYRYSYPLIQYKRLSEKATIVCIDDGVNVVGELLEKEHLILKIGKREVTAKIEKIIPNRILVQTWKEKFSYFLKGWLALNSENYLKYKNTESLKERINLLEQILKGNLLSVCKGLDIFISEEITVEIQDISSPRVVVNKGVRLMVFDVRFLCNLSLPQNMGIGKNASIGYGILKLNRKEKEYEE